MNRRLVVAALAGALLLAACDGGAATGGPGDTLSDWEPSASLAPDPEVVDGLTRIAYQDGPDRLVLRTQAGEIDFLTGLNVGATVPGHAPGELAVDRETWARWFEQIGRTGVHAIRVYTILPPDFYEELLAFNEANPDRPLYVVHGVWIPEEAFLATRDLWDDEVVARMEADVADAVAVVHGDASLPERAGFASGTYTADVSPWVLSWALGVELDPHATHASNATNADRPPHRGTYVRSTDDASPTETWLAHMLDLLASEEADRGRTMPLTFTNWPTTDPLDHPLEPLESEDLVGVDAEHVVTTDAWPGGRYASQHAYPYYPDFQRYEYADVELDGVVDNFAGYLTALRDHHVSQPLVILETGVPSSIGSAHLGPLGRDQGGHTEPEAMAIKRDIVEVIDRVGLSGAFLFQWADEWFKLTWNTADLEIPADRRPMWHNPLTNESYFGLLAVEPGENGRVVTIDGSGEGFTADNSQVVHEGPAPVTEVRAIHDEERLFLRILADGAPWDDAEGITVAFELLPGEGGGPLPSTTTEVDEADVLLTVADGRADLLVRTSLDPNAWVYGEQLGFVEVEPGALEPGSGDWTPLRQMVNRPLTVPGTGVENPPEWHEINPLVRGTTDPDQETFDSNATWAADDGVLELALPWGMLGFADPSSRQLLVPGPDGLDTATVERAGITVVVGDRLAVPTAGYAWESWQSVTWHERPKRGIEVLLDALRSRAVPADAG